jgi:hypothetical protein
VASSSSRFFKVAITTKYFSINLYYIIYVHVDVQKGLPGIGINIAHQLAQTGLGEELLVAAQGPLEALDVWQEHLRQELRHDSNRFLG